MVKHSAFEIDIRDRFHQGFTCSFCMRGAQKHKKDSQVVSLFTLSGSAYVKDARKYVGEINPQCFMYFFFFRFTFSRNVNFFPFLLSSWSFPPKTADFRLSKISHCFALHKNATLKPVLPPPSSPSLLNSFFSFFY
jgi:hypothetical protein